MERTITLTDGEHTLRTPTYYGLQLIDELGGNKGSMMKRLPAILAALLTDSEPLDERHRPAREWGIVEVAKLIPLDAPADALWEATAELMTDAMPPAKEEPSGRPPTRPGGKRRSAPPESS